MRKQSVKVLETRVSLKEFLILFYPRSEDEMTDMVGNEIHYYLKALIITLLSVPTPS
jgi:hypothetical protein